jgi:hypothetical protein
MPDSRKLPVTAEAEVAVEVQQGNQHVHRHPLVIN